MNFIRKRDAAATGHVIGIGLFVIIMVMVKVEEEKAVDEGRTWAMGKDTFNENASLVAAKTLSLS